MTRYWFISTKYRYHATYALLTFLFAFGVALLGAYTRLTDAGLACPDWPNCYGQLTAPHTPSQLAMAAKQYPLSPVNVKKAWTEMVHRYAALAEGTFILLLCFSLTLAQKAKDMTLWILGLVLFCLLAIQIALGMFTVTEKLRPMIVLAHLLTGISILSVLWWVYLDLHLPNKMTYGPANDHVTPWLWVGALIVIVQITLGGLVSSHYAGLACIDFPFCNGHWLPPLQWHNMTSDLLSIHMLHRIGALVTCIYFSLFAFILITIPPFRTLALLLLALVALQVTLGILNIIWLRPVWIAMLHHGTAITLLLTMITALVKNTLSLEKYHGPWVT